MSTIKRKMKKEKASVDMHSLCEGKLIQVQKYLNELTEKYGDSAVLVLDWYYEDLNIYIEYERLETEVEAVTRVKAAQLALARRKAKELKLEEKERKELARLTKKYVD